MELKKYKLGEILDVTRGASLSGEFYAAKGEYVPARRSRYVQ